MSRIGKKIIKLPANVEMNVSAGKVMVKGPKTTLERPISPLVFVDISGKEVKVTPVDVDNSAADIVSGTTVSHLENMIQGVVSGYTKKLIIEGIGYKAEVKGKELVLGLGLSHPVAVPIPASIKVESEKGVLTITGSNKEEVGQFAASIRALKKPEPYKGKGIRYEDEVIRRKQGKKTA